MVRFLAATCCNLACCMQASRILANLIVAGGSVIVRAAAQAWRQAVVSKFASLGTIFLDHTLSQQALTSCSC